MIEYVGHTGTQYIDTGIKPDRITLFNNVTGNALMSYECIPYRQRHFAAKVVEDINAETCEAIRKHLFAKGYTDILFLDDKFIRTAISKALQDLMEGDTE